MKKRLLFLPFLFCIVSLVAQTNYYFKAGVAFPKYSSEIMLGDNSSFFIYPEAGATFNLNRRTNFSSGLGFKTFIFKDVGGVTGMGGYIDDNGDSIVTYTNAGTTKERTILFNVAVPLYFTYNFDLRYSRSNFFLAFDLGFEPTMNVYSKMSTSNEGKVDVNFFSSNLIFGTRVGKTISNSWTRSSEMEVGFRYCYALQDLTKFPQFGADVFQLMLGLTFGR
ncbi:MAG: hypothetical protein JXQ69_09080 [Paludibacteraceae bacterium]|nr:hypothetical protein [Paludibacteraceae bacterium]MBN2788457.1 hypothetical protein [Paludibacteraceae bacterium]